MAAAGWDQGQVFAASVLPPETNENTHSDLERRFFEFIQVFTNDRREFIYLDRLRANLLMNKPCLDVSLDHVIAFDENLAQAVKDRPVECLPDVFVLLCLPLP